MSGYLRSKVFETDFDGDKVKARLKPLAFADLLKFQSAKDDMEAVVIFQEILPRYIEELTGLNDNAGSPVSVQEICSHVYFTELVKELGVTLMNASNIQRPLKPAEPSAS